MLLQIIHERSLNASSTVLTSHCSKMYSAQRVSWHRFSLYFMAKNIVSRVGEAGFITEDIGIQ